MKKIYIVKYWEGDYRDGFATVIFATYNKEFAEEYVKRFNEKLQYWTDYYSGLDGEKTTGFNWKQENLDHRYFRWCRLSVINGAYFE